MRYNVNWKVNLKDKKGGQPMKEYMIESAGKGKIHCASWEPEGQPQAIVQIVHGIAEHIGRYNEFAEFLAANGILVVAEDHMGHGGSVADGDVKGYFHNGWMAAVKDVYSLTKRTQQLYPDVPYFLLGHSMGSFLARTYLFTYPDSGIDGVILSGTGWQNPAMLTVGIGVCDMEAKRYTDTGCSPLIQSLIFGAYNKQIPNARTENDWICTVPEVVDAYTADPLSGFAPTVGLARDMLLGIRMIQKKSNLKKMRRDLPVYFFSGANDPVGANGKGVEKAADAFRKAGMQNVTCKLYPDGRHEMLNESNKDEVYQDVLNKVNAYMQ
jgi:alpha-beta hydrolase superfamily lysophospholipase